MKSLRASNHRFLGIVYFQWFNAFSFRAISHRPFSTRKGLIDASACARERGLAPLCETEFRMHMTDAGHAISCHCDSGRRFGHGCLDYHGELAQHNRGFRKKEVISLFLFYRLLSAAPSNRWVVRVRVGRRGIRAARGWFGLTGPQGRLARTADVWRDNSRLRFPSACPLFPATHNVLKSLGSKARPRLSFTWMQAYIVA